MKELTVIELSEQTGLTRSQIYYLNKKHNLINSNEKNFRQILNMLILQNMALQKQLDLANEREKTYLSELTSCRQNLTQKPTLTPSKDENNAQTGLDNIDENSRNLIQSENETHNPKESCQGINKEIKSTSETDIHPFPTESLQNEITLSESESGDAEPTAQKKEAIEQKDNALFGTPSPNQDDTKRPPTLNRHKKVTATIAARIPKSISITVPRSLSDNKQKSPSPINESITDQNNLNKKDHHDY